MTTADGIEITADMDLWDIDGLRYQPAASNVIDPDPENWAWQHAPGGPTSTVWPHRSRGPWLSSRLASLTFKHARKAIHLRYIRKMARRMIKAKMWDHATTLAAIASDLDADVLRLEDEIVAIAGKKIGEGGHYAG